MKRLWYISLVLFIMACDQESSDIPSVEERKAAATAELVEELTSPANGWRIDYKPTSQAGTFFILMDFSEEGTVRIQSDVSDNDGEFLDQTLTYRIDHDLATELVLETYGVFHYLFELNQNTFGAEFEFLYQGKVDDHLIFKSKTDATVLTFQPAQSTDAALISTEIVSQLAQGAYRQGTILGLGSNAIYQFYLPDDNVSVFTTFDLGYRRAKVFGAAQGKSFDDLINSTGTTRINSTTDIAFLNEEVVFERSIEFELGGKSYSFSGFSAADFQVADTSFCADDNGSFVTFDGEASGLGEVEIRSSLFSSHSTFFDDDEEFYTSSNYYIFDENDSTLGERLEESFEFAEVFVLLHNATPRGYSDGTLSGVGFAGFDESNRVQFYVRLIEVVQTAGNLLELTLTDDTYITVSDSLAERDALFQFTDELFEGGKVYATEVLSFEDLYEVYNPCNQYKFFVFE